LKEKNHSSQIAVIQSAVVVVVHVIEHGVVFWKLLNTGSLYSTKEKFVNSFPAWMANLEKRAATFTSLPGQRPKVSWALYVKKVLGCFSSGCAMFGSAGVLSKGGILGQAIWVRAC
jgi:hypothetical protein